MMNLDWSHRAAGPQAAACASGLEFPQRGWCLGGDWLDHRLGEALRRLEPSAPAAGRGSIDNVWYLPGRRFQVVYRMESGRRAVLSFQREHAERGVPPAAAAGWLPEARAWAWLWPQDPAGLPLQRWSDPAWADAQLRAADPEELRSGGPASCQVLSYLPGERCAIGWVRAGEQRPSWVMKGQPGACAPAQALQALWDAPGRSFAMPRPLPGASALHERCGQRWETFVAGERLEAAARRLGWPTVLRAAAAAMADLHRLRLPGLRVHDEDQALQRLSGKVLKRIRLAVPGVVPDCEDLLARLRASQPAPGPQATLHGDLHTGNLLYTPEGRIAFIDLDDLVQGAPAHDLALLASRLMLVGLLDPARAPGLARPLQELPGWYLEAGGDPRAVAAYPWYLALLLVSRQLKTCIRHAAPDLDRLAGELVRLAQRLTERTQSSAP